MAINLTKDQFSKLVDLLRHPDPIYMQRRDAVFQKMDEEITITHNGQDMEVDIPCLDLSMIGG